MEKVRGAGLDDNRQILRRSPVQHVLQRNYFVVGAMDGNGFGGVGYGGGGCALCVVADGGADQGPARSGKDKVR